MRTRIHVTKKLEKLIKKHISENKTAEDGILGKWNATVFYVDRKKCWLVSHGLTKYNVILPNITAKEVRNIEPIFKIAFMKQLICDGIELGDIDIDSLIGTVDLLPTDGDRSTISFQNQRLIEFEYWKHEYRMLENMHMRYLTGRLNSVVIHIGESKKMSDYTTSKDEMKKLFSNVSVISNETKCN